MAFTANSGPFLKFASICSFLGALTTALLIFVPDAVAEGFEQQVALHENSQYLAKRWILFLHPQFNFIAALGMGYLLFRKYPLQILLGLFFLGLWAVSEITQQALVIDALNQIWRPGYAVAGSESDQALYRTLIQGAGGLSDTYYFLVIYGFGLGSLLFGLAFVHLGSWARWIGWALIFIGALSLASFARYYLGVTSLNGIVNGAYQWIYPYLQPLVRVAMGIWILGQLRWPHTGGNANGLKGVI